MNSIPYWCRVAALLALAAVLIFHDMRKGSSTRLWEYGCLFLVGTVGAVYGAANDAITVWMSPDYFVLGKGLDAGESLTSNAIRLGSQAGFSAAVIACAIWLFALRHTPAPRRCRLLAATAWLPFATAVAFSLGGAVFLRRLDPLRFSLRLAGIITPDRVMAFLTVWWVHAGAYLGLCAGLTGAIMLTRKQAHAVQNIMLESIRR